MSTTMDPRQRWIFMALPLVFVLFIVNASFPVGLLLYWVTTNLWTVGQGLVTRRLMPKPQAPPKRSSRTPPKEAPADDGAASVGKAAQPSRGRLRPAARQAPEEERPTVAAMSETERELSETEAEATGETVGEAKWAALRELERRFPGIDKSAVSFAVLSEGERGLLGVGYAPARVIAKAGAVPPPFEAGDEEPDSPAARLRELLDRVCAALGAPVRIDDHEDDEQLTATLTGPELGLVIGKRGQTIDAIQYLATAIVFRGLEERKSILVDAAGYRDRRRATLEQQADRAASEALAAGGSVALDPMSAVERKIVHVHLQEREDVETASEGNEPNRFVVVRPV